MARRGSSVNTVYKARDRGSFKPLRAQGVGWPASYSNPIWTKGRGRPGVGRRYASTYAAPVTEILMAENAYSEGTAEEGRGSECGPGSVLPRWGGGLGRAGARRPGPPQRGTGNTGLIAHHRGNQPQWPLPDPRVLAAAAT